MQSGLLVAFLELVYLLARRRREMAIECDSRLDLDHASGIRFRQPSVEDAEG